MDQKTMAKAYREWLDKIKQVAAGKLVPSLKQEGMIVDENIFRASVSYDSPYHLAGIQNFSSLIPISQKLSKPIFDLTREDGHWAGAIWERMNNGKEYGAKFNIQEANNVYTSLSQSVLKMIA